jgi:Uma2 family endonuclease
MSAGTLPTELPRRRFTVEDVYRMTEDGILNEDEAVELLDGELVLVSPQDPSHAAHLAELHQRLADAYGRDSHIRDQLPLDAKPHSLPEPDLAVVKGQPRDYRDRHPTGRDVRLVIEVARSSQAIDRKKASIYASAQAPVYWLIDLALQRLEVFSEPSNQGSYLQQRVLIAGQDVDLPGLDLRWPVSDLVG